MLGTEAIEQRIMEIGTDMVSRIDSQRDIFARKFVALHQGIPIKEINRLVDHAIERDMYLFIREKYKIDFSGLPSELRSLFRASVFSKTVSLTPGGHAHITRRSN